jgi:hypothetical protein
MVNTDQRFGPPQLLPPPGQGVLQLRSVTGLELLVETAQEELHQQPFPWTAAAMLPVDEHRALQSAAVLPEIVVPLSHPVEPG